MKMKWFPVRRVMLVFNKETDVLVRRYELSSFKLKEIQRVFNQEPGDLMYYVYRITENEAPYFRKKYGRRFHFKKYEYCLECERKK
jgi:hypothetical protein